MVSVVETNGIKFRKEKAKIKKRETSLSISSNIAYDQIGDRRLLATRLAIFGKARVQS